MSNKWRVNQLRSAATRRSAESTSEAYKNSHKSETIDVSKVSKPFNIVDGKAVDIVRTEWNTTELQEDFTVIGFGHGYCAVKRKSDGVTGSLDFDHSPRKYYNFKESV